jgi:hypothetical protein
MMQGSDLAKATNANASSSTTPSPAATPPSVAAIPLKDRSPDAACNYLSEYPQFKTSGYKTLLTDSDYGCISQMYKLDNSFPVPNNIAYYVDGTSSTVTSLRLVLNVNNKANAVSAHEALQRYSEALIRHSLNSSLPKTIKESIKEGHSAQVDVKGATVEVTRDDWPTGKGYELHFNILWQ